MEVLVFGDDDGLDGHALQEEADVVDGDQIGGVDHGEGQPVVGELDRDDLVLADQVLRHHLEDLGRHLDLAQIDVAQTVLQLQRVLDGGLRDVALLDQDHAEGLFGLLLDLDGLLELAFRDEIGVEEDLPQFHLD
ncbi:hypothetical protein D3C78_1623740 [compost metagenome]